MPRKTTTIVSCSYNGCKDYAEVLDANEAPEGWYMVLCSRTDPKHGHSYSRSESFEFSSLRCMEKWAHDRKAVLHNIDHPDEEPQRIHTASVRAVGGWLDPRDVIEAIRLLAENGSADGVTTAQIAEMLDRPKGTIKNALTRLQDSGEVEQVGERLGRGTPTNLFLLTERG